ncbi:AAA family ATPase [Janthinobacterium sp. EB271-G4-7A]|uniref:AAA family ATPase n=1 Tax=Janthinobacterium sp. EB271-G4-7A TaxID=2775056 RepID=UPI001E425040|nr:AAA family ATPase [Janthinobacterium sp. EB271-G4-7A]MCC7699247.1 AAA family ATPase [Janthinobacterium sp. EB271-G4-7A]
MESVINQIDIASFGSFRGLDWKKTVKDSGKTVQNFKRLNILYGRNYSGKTTLSRVFRALETRKVPLNYLTPSFTIYGDQGNVTQATIPTHNYDVRVYNRDFVTDNLDFLVHQQIGGEIKTFAIVGDKNKEIEDAITAIETQLGKVEDKTGLRFELDGKKKEQVRTKTNHSTAASGLEDKLRAHANEKIKKNREYGSAVYNIESIKRDILAGKQLGFKPLTIEEQAAKLTLLKQEALSDISGSLKIQLKLDFLRSTASPLLSKEIKPTKPIQELLNDSVLQMWVKQGIGHHREKRESCAFCSQNLPHDIWQTLDEHFSKESGDLETALDVAITSVTDEIKAITGFNNFRSDQFYAEERSAFDSNSKALTEALTAYKNDLETLNNDLESRKSNLFQVVSMKDPIHSADEIQKHVDAINALILTSNGKTKTLDRDKNTARETLRLFDVYTFAQAVNYDAEVTRIATLKTEATTANTTFIEANAEILKLEAEITTWRAKEKDERKGADRINSLLNHFFGHDGIKLEAKDNTEKTAVKFEITRDGKSAYNLSEGECSLIAFCYFIAKLEEPDSKGKDLIIYIDDPICSLDGNHIFFVFSLIESLIARPLKNPDGTNKYRYKQLFISTHNLDFLKYLKKLSLPPEKNHGGNQYFIIERNGTASSISLMPSYLKEYITEFNYLFHQIYKCRDAEYAKVSHEPFYSFGNNLRKFLEALLFYKYPHQDDKNDSLERMKKFFGDDDAAITLINRLNNELSHLESIFDRSMKPIEIPEIPKLANYVLDKIYEADPHQYNSLLKSIGEIEIIK